MFLREWISWLVTRMSEEAFRLAEWEEQDGGRACIIVVEDDEMDYNDIERRRIELCKYDSSIDKWNTEEVISYVREITSVSIPEDMLD